MGIASPEVSGPGGQSSPLVRSWTAVMVSKAVSNARWTPGPEQYNWDVGLVYPFQVDTHSDWYGSWFSCLFLLFWVFYFLRTEITKLNQEEESKLKFWESDWPFNPSKITNSRGAWLAQWIEPPSLFQLRSRSQVMGSSRTSGLPVLARSLK